MAKLEYSEIIDISMPLNAETIIYPNNPELTIQTVKSGNGSQLSKITIGSHTGTHIDAPNHVIPGAPGIDHYPLTQFIGRCRVLDLTMEKYSISIEALESCAIQSGESILLKTQNSVRTDKQFRADYIYLEPEAAEYLATIGVQLIGIDSLSIKQQGAETNMAHTAFLEQNIPIIEGLQLAQVEEGEYTMVILPLAFTALDSSPARAILLR